MMEATSHKLKTRPETDSLAERLQTRSVCWATGLWGSSYAFLAAALAETAPGPILLITPTVEDADNAAIDLDFFLHQGSSVDQFPAWESLPSDDLPLNRDILTRRLSVLQGLAERRDGSAAFVVAPVLALQQPVIDQEALARTVLEFRVGEDRPLEEVAIWLTDRSFERLPQVDAQGEFSIRGGILDIFPLGAEWPIRIEYFGDTVDSIRRFDPASQRSTENLGAARIVAVQESAMYHLKQSGNGVSLLDYLPPDTWVFVKEPTEVQRRAQDFSGGDIAKRELFSYEELWKVWNAWPNLYLTEFPEEGREDGEAFTVRSIERFSGEISTLSEELKGLAIPNDRVCIVCANEGERERLQELLAEGDLAGDSKLEFMIGSLTRGFEMDEVRTAFVVTHELFQRYTGQMRPARRRHRSAPVEDWLDLDPGDLVVHVVHGIARYEGLIRRESNGEEGEFLVLEFAEATRLEVPVTHIDLVHKYLGPAKAKPRPSKLGGTRWAKKKQDVQEAVEDLALELLKVQAIRESQPGSAFPYDDHWQHEFEASFPFEATEDQISATAAIKEDLAQARPMDRLLCGDVGYGKTEVAMRAAFKAVMAGKQVGILAPTTILAQQHYRTFSERMAEYPVRIEVVSRFRSKPDQKRVLEEARKGAVDILIGTHRIVQKDVEFRDLGLLIIDEEQRFGVEQKEFLKWARQTVEVLTMTATPIPRTLHMALVGIRDISALNTPPEDRQSIRTQVCRYDPRLIRDAIVREMRRGGQVFFLHNRVQTIHQMATKLAEIVPEARIVVGHGQMPEGELERNMTEFINRFHDILLCTTIIGSGVDIPNVNTIFVNEADRFGLAEMHQLRGRVGRYKHRAFAYFLAPEDRPITQKAMRRLKAIEEFSELGSGFKIAMRDLEIRGAGNILGPEQSGHIGSVGYELYCKLLDITVRQIKDKSLVISIDVRVDLGFPAFLPNAYVSTERQKMEIYRRVSRCYDLPSLEELRDSLKDRFGPLPEPAGMMLTKAELRILAQPWKIDYVRVLQDRIELRSSEARRVAGDLQVGRDLVRHLDAKTVHVLFPKGVQKPGDICEYAKELLGTKKLELAEGSSVLPSALVESMRPRK